MAEQLIIPVICGVSAVIGENETQATARKTIGDPKGTRTPCGGCTYERVNDPQSAVQYRFAPGQSRLRNCEDENAPTA